MTNSDSISTGVAAAAARVFGGSVADRALALALAVLLHPASWLIGIAVVFSGLDWIAGREVAKAAGTFRTDKARAGFTSKGVTWAILLLVWLVALALIELGTRTGFDTGLTILVPIYFTVKLIVAELRSLDGHIEALTGASSIFHPLVELLEGVLGRLGQKVPTVGRGKRDA